MTPDKLPWWKRRSRFTLCALLVFVTLFMLWGGYHTNRGRQERAAIEVLRQGGAKLHDVSMPVQATVGERAGWYYTRFAAFVWREPLVTGAAFHQPPTPAQTDALVKLPHLRTLYVAPFETGNYDYQAQLDAVVVKTTPLPQEFLKRVLADQRLRGVTLCYWDLTEEECRALGAQRNLVGLSLHGCSCSEEGFASLVQAPRLFYLRITNCQVTGEKLARVPGSATLEEVMATKTPLGPEFAAFIARSPKVKSLECEHPQQAFDDAFVTALGRHPQLAYLLLGKCEVTPAILPKLQQLPKLEILSFQSRHFSAADKDHVKAALPEVEVR